MLTYGMSYSQQRFSPLSQINRDTVRRLVPVWSYSMNNNTGEESQPLIYDGVMYVTSQDKTVAIDALTGKEIWNPTLRGWFAAGSSTAVRQFTRVRYSAPRSMLGQAPRRASLGTGDRRRH